MKSFIQSILFSRNKYTPLQARNWLKKHGFKFNDLDIKPLHLRFRQKYPYKKYSYKTKRISYGIEFIVGY